MGPNTSVFKEPRGVMRIIQFIFAIVAFATTVGYTNSITIWYCADLPPLIAVFDYPFELDKMIISVPPCNNTDEILFHLVGDFSSDAQFFVATGVLSMLYCIGICVVYVLFDANYQSNALIPMADFMLTVLLAVFWLSGSAAWANGLDGLKSVTSSTGVQSLSSCAKIRCTSSVGSFSGLNISVIIGFLNFFLWASDLWFLYKETQWFKNAGPVAAPATSPGFK